MVLENLFKVFLKGLIQYKNKSVYLRNNRFIFALLKGFSKFSKGTKGKAQSVISVKLSWQFC